MRIIQLIMKAAINVCEIGDQQFYQQQHIVYCDPVYFLTIKYL